MAEEVKVEQQPVPEVKPVVKPELDLVSRVSQVKVEPKPTETEESKFNINDLDSAIEKVPDPTLKEQMLGLKKSLLRGENQKYQEIANLRKQYEQKLAEVTTWTPERIQQEINKPDFVQAAQAILKTQNTEEQDSFEENPKIKKLEQEILSLKGNSFQALKTSHDSQLKTKYNDYDSDIVDSGIEKLSKMSPIEIREYIHKALKYETHIKNAYEMGKQDKLLENQEKVNGMTFTEGRNIPSPSGVERMKGETVQQFMLRSYQEHSKKK